MKKNDANNSPLHHLELAIGSMVQQQVDKILNQKRLTSQTDMAKILNVKVESLRRLVNNGRLKQGVHYEIVGVTQRYQIYAFYEQGFIDFPPHMKYGTEKEL